ncbi:MAG TPA: iron-containing redox enzyme family protein [Polyangiales bacterium]|nr:iron-containing redox enzyme family protein [Polyangiales bacterium]
MEHFISPLQQRDLLGDAAAQNRAFFAKLMERTLEHAFFAHAFLSAASDESPVSRELATLVLTGFYQVVEPFTGLLCSLAAKAPSLRSRFVLMDNLFEELGRGDFEAAHPRLYLSMLDSIGVSRHTAESADRVPAIRRIQEHLAETVERQPFAVSCAVLASAESIIPASFPVLARMAQRACPCADMRFFDRHGVRDDGHAGDAATLFVIHADPSQWRCAEREVTLHLDCRLQLLDVWMDLATSTTDTRG